MASSLIGQLRIALGLETASLETGARKAKQELKGIEEAAKSVREMLGTVMAAFAIEAIGETIKRSLEHIEVLGKQAKALGVNVVAFQEYRYAVGQAGVSGDAFDKSIFKLSKSLGDARNGAEAPKKAFAELSKIIGHDITAGTGDVLKILPQMSEALKQIEDPTRRNSIEAQLLGRGYREMAPFLALGAEEIDRLRNSAHELGIVLSEEQIQNAEVTAHKLKTLHDVLQARIDGAVAANARAIYDLANSFVKLAGSLATFWSKNPRLAMAIIGGLVGGRVGGLPGAAVGVVLGAALGPDTPTSLRSQARQEQLLSQARFRTFYGDPNKYTPQQRHDIIEHDRHLRASRDRFANFMSKARSMEQSDAMAPEEGGTATPGQFLAPKHHERKKRDDSEQRAKEAERIKYEFDKLELDGKRQMLEAQRSLTVDTEERNAIAGDILQVDHDQKALEINHRLRLVQIDKTVSAEQKAAAEKTAQKELRLNDELLIINRRVQGLQAELEREQQFEQTEQVVLAGKTERLNLERDLALTTEKRRTIELEILDLAHQEKVARLKRVMEEQYLGQYTHTQDERNRALIELADENKNYGLSREKVIRGTRSPLEELSASIPDTTARMKEAIETNLVDTLRQANDSLAQQSAGWIKVGGVAGDVLRNIYVGVMKILMARYLEKPAADFLSKALSLGTAIAGGGGGGGAPPGFGFDWHSLPPFAAGGSLVVGGMGGVDHNLLSVNGTPAARIGKGERLDIVPANDRGPSGATFNLFDLKGAVVTEDLLAQMNELADNAAARGAAGGAVLAREQFARATRRSLRRS